MGWFAFFDKGAKTIHKEVIVFSTISIYLLDIHILKNEAGPL